MVAVVPAAGKGERFGAHFKLLAPVGDAPLLERTIRSLIDGGVTDVVVVVAPHSRVTPERVPSLSLPSVHVVVNPDPSRGMFSSIQAGVLAPVSSAPFLVLPGDMPFVTAATVAAVVAAAAHSQRVVTPRHHGRRGHPIALPASLRDVIARADPHSALNVLLAPYGRPDIWLDVDVTDPGILRDVDVAADL